MERGGKLPVLDSIESVVAAVRQATRPTYVRFSTAPPEGLDEPSVDGETGLELPGLSVNPLDPPRWWRERSPEEWIVRRICSYAHLQSGDPSRVCWLVHGDLVDRGPDNEPLIGDAEAVAIIDRAVVDDCRRRRIDDGLESAEDVDRPPPWQAVPVRGGTGS
jgi:hypothetical protein